MNEIDPHAEVYEVPPPESPIRRWSNDRDDLIVMEIRLLIEQSTSGASMDRLLRGEPLSDSDMAAFGRLNFIAFVDHFEPPVALLGEPRLHPRLLSLLSV